MLVSTAALAAALSLIRMPSPAEVAPLLELVVELVRPAPIAEPEILPAPPGAVPIEEVVSPPAAPETRTEPVPAGDAAAVDDEAVDWELAREEAIREVLDAAGKEQAYAVNPPFERARREAAVRFRASVAPDERHVWDHVEKDQLGRTILRDGNCFRVLNDPSAVNRWAFENFDQFIVYCDFTFGPGEGQELPWVDIIRERYPYLRNPVAIP